MTQKVRWGMLSTANIGLKALVPAIRSSQHGEFVAVSSRTLDKAQQAAAEFDIQELFDDIGSAAGDDSAPHEA